MCLPCPVAGASLVPRVQNPLVWGWWVKQCFRSGSCSSAGHCRNSLGWSWSSDRPPPPGSILRCTAGLEIRKHVRELKKKMSVTWSFRRGQFSGRKLEKLEAVREWTPVKESLQHYTREWPWKWCERFMFFLQSFVIKCDIKSRVLTNKICLKSRGGKNHALSCLYWERPKKMVVRIMHNDCIKKLIWVTCQRTGSLDKKSV